MHSSLAEVPRRRRRALLSCYECHRRRVKCDRKNPCTRCTNSKSHCTYNLNGPYDGPESKVSSMSVENPVFLSSRQTKREPSTIVSSPSASRRVSNLGEGNDPSQGQNTIIPATLLLESHVRRVRERPNLSSGIQDINRPDTDTLSKSEEASRILSPTAQAIVNKTRVFGQSHWMNTCSEFQFLTRSLIVPTTKIPEDAQLNAARKDASMLLHRCKMLARELKQDRPGRTYDVLPHNKLQATPRDIADRAIEMYASYFESMFRILHVPTLRADYKQFWTDPNNQCESTTLIIRLCLAIGSSIDHYSDRMNIKLAAYSVISTAQCWLSAPFEKDRLSIGGLQVQCLLLLARQIFSVGGDLIWVSTGTLINSAIQIGLNRDPAHFPGLSCFQVQIRRRLWATIMELSSQASLDAGTFPLIRPEDFDTSPPANVNDRDFDEVTDTLSERPEDIPTDTSLQRSLLKSLPTRLQILRGMNIPKPVMSHETALMIATNLKTFCQDLQGAIPRDNTYQFKHNMADFFLRRFILSLHNPFANQARKSPQYYYSRKICLDTAMTILSPPRTDEFSRLVLVAGGMFKIRLRLIGLALGSELLSDINENGQLHTAYREMLLEALKQTRGDALARTGFGDTSVRLNLILSMLITRAELMNTQDEVELKMVQSAKKALEESFSILKAQIQTPIHPTNENSVENMSMSFSPEYDIEFDEFLQLANWNSDVAMENWSMLV